MSGFHTRKAERREYFLKYVYGWRLRTCGACNGSGYYDDDGSLPYGSCSVSGRERYRHPIKQKEQK